MGFIINLLINGLAVFLSSYILPGVHVDSFVTAVIVALLLGIVNALIRPILLILTLPINILTLGLFTFIINGLLVLLVTNIVPGFKVDGLLWAILFSLVMAVIGSILHGVVK